MSRILAIDYGLARVGLAVSDPDGKMAFPLRTLARTTRDALFRELLEVMQAEGVSRLVVGYPGRVGGEESLTGRQVKNFVASLGRRTDLPIDLVDEAHSTEVATDLLREAGLSGARLLERVDAQAAAVILERYLTGGGAVCCEA